MRHIDFFVLISVFLNDTRGQQKGCKKNLLTFFLRIPQNLFLFFLFRVLFFLTAPVVVGVRFNFNAVTWSEFSETFFLKWLGLHKYGNIADRDGQKFCRVKFALILFRISNSDRI